jgi:hypothetical protein
LGVYRVAQVARHLGHDVLLRLELRTATRLLRSAGVTDPPVSGHEYPVAWQPASTTVCEPELPGQPIPGRLIYLYLRPDGFRPFAVYLFTTLLDANCYPLTELCALYSQRWCAEVDYRHLKTVLDMAEFAVHSAALFRKELAAGLVAYNLICALMLQAALAADLAPHQLSFSQCRRRIESLLTQGHPARLATCADPVAALLTRLAHCRLPHQPNKVDLRTIAR